MRVGVSAPPVAGAEPVARRLDRKLSCVGDLGGACPAPVCAEEEVHHGAPRSCSCFDLVQDPRLFEEDLLRRCAGMLCTERAEGGHGAARGCSRAPWAAGCYRQERGLACERCLLDGRKPVCQCMEPCMELHSCVGTWQGTFTILISATYTPTLSHNPPSLPAACHLTHDHLAVRPQGISPVVSGLTLYSWVTW